MNGSAEGGANASAIRPHRQRDDPARLVQPHGGAAVERAGPRPCQVVSRSQSGRRRQPPTSPAALRSCSSRCAPSDPGFPGDGEDQGGLRPSDDVGAFPRLTLEASLRIGAVPPGCAYPRAEKSRACRPVRGGTRRTTTTRASLVANRRTGWCLGLSPAFVWPRVAATCSRSPAIANVQRAGLMRHGSGRLRRRTLQTRFACGERSAIGRASASRSSQRRADRHGLSARSCRLGAPRAWL